MLGLAGSQEVCGHLELSLCVPNGEKLLLREAGVIVEHLAKDLDEGGRREKGGKGGGERERARRGKRGRSKGRRGRREGKNDRVTIHSLVTPSTL